VDKTEICNKVNKSKIYILVSSRKSRQNLFKDNRSIRKWIIQRTCRCWKHELLCLFLYFLFLFVWHFTVFFFSFPNY